MPADVRRGSGTPSTAATFVAPFAGAISLVVACLIVSAKRPLWYDEVATTILVGDPSLRHMLRAMLAGVESAPPLYHFVARAWAALFGTGATALRLLSSCAMAVGLVVFWAGLRRVTGARAASIGALAVFGTSEVVLRQNHEVRFYGLWMMFCAIAVYFCIRFIEETAPRRHLLVGGLLAHMAVVLTHTFGVLYVGVLLLAVLASDLVRRRLRPLTYATYVGGWLAFLPWVGPTIGQSALGTARSWVPMPGIGIFLPAYQFGMTALPLLVLAIVMLAALERGAARDATAFSPPPRSTPHALFIAGGLLVVPLLVFVISRVIRPLFIDRYMLPSVLAWGLVLAYLIRALSPATPAIADDEGSRARSRGGALVTAGWIGLCALLAAYPVLMALALPAAPTGTAAIEQLRTEYRQHPDERMIVAVESGIAFLPLRHAESPEGERYFYPTDWDIALDPAGPANAVAFDQYLRLLREHYAEARVVSTQELLCMTRRFLVIDGPWLWFERRVASDPAYTSRVIGRFDDEMTVRLVERTTDLPQECSTAGAAAPAS